MTEFLSGISSVLMAWFVLSLALQAVRPSVVWLHARSRHARRQPLTAPIASRTRNEE